MLLASLFCPDVTTVWPGFEALRRSRSGCPAGGRSRRRPACATSCSPSRRPALRGAWRAGCGSPSGAGAASPRRLAAGRAVGVAAAGASAGFAGAAARRLDDVDVVAVEAGHHRRLRQRDDVRRPPAARRARARTGRGAARRRGSPPRRCTETMRVCGSIFGSMPMMRPSIGELLLRQPERRRLAHLQLAELLLRHGEVDAHRVELLQRGDHRRPAADIRRHRCAECRSMPAKGASIAFWSSTARILASADVGCGERALRLLERGFGADAGLAQPLARARAAAWSRASAASRRHQVGALDRIVDLHEQLACLDAVVGLEVDRLHDARDLRRDVDALDGRQRADRVDLAASRSSARPRSPRPSTAGICMVAKNSPIILARKKLNQTSSAQKRTTSTRMMLRTPVHRQIEPKKRIAMASRQIFRVI